jgi:hypothetical protein
MVASCCIGLIALMLPRPVPPIQATSFAPARVRVRTMQGIGLFAVNAQEVLRRNNSPEALANRLAKRHIKVLAIRVHGLKGWAPRVEEIELHNLQVALASHDIELWAWGFPYASREDNFQILQTKVMDSGLFSGYVMDVEGQNGSASGRIEALWKALRAHRDKTNPGFVLGYTGFGNPGEKPWLCYDVCDRYADVSIPQAYHGDWHITPKAAVNRCYRSILKVHQKWASEGYTGPYAPVFPMDQAYGKHTGVTRIPGKEVSAFLAYTKGYGMRFLYSADLMDEEQWNAAGTAGSGAVVTKKEAGGWRTTLLWPGLIFVIAWPVIGVLVGKRVFCPRPRPDQFAIMALFGMIVPILAFLHLREKKRHVPGAIILPDYPAEEEEEL